MENKLNASENALGIIKKYESLQLKAYKCPAGILTIGYGHTGTDVVPGQTINETFANSLLKLDCRKAELTINNNVIPQLNQNQFDALVSFVFNVGGGAFKNSTLFKKLNANDFVNAANEFDKWVHAGNKVLPGLVKRRAEEKELFLKNC